MSCSGSKSSSKWIEKVNRGSLVVINDDFYILVGQLEMQARKTWNLNFVILYSGGNIKLKVFLKLTENNLTCYWEKLIRSVINEGLKEKLKEML